MHSVALRQAVTTALDSAGMRGPVNRREIAEQIYRATHSRELWAPADEREACIAYLIDGIREIQSEPLSAEDLPNVPRRYQALLSDLPRWICISTSGLHQMTINATPDDWAATARIKHRIAEAVAVKVDQANDIYRLLMMEGANSIAELGVKQAA